MGKLSKLLLNSFFASSAIAENFQVTSCNDETTPQRLPALTFQIAKEYFEDRLSDQANNFKLTNGLNGAFYERTIPEEDLTLSFDSEKDAILLSYTLALAASPTNFQLSDAVSIGFGEDSIVFQCQYARAVTANSQMIINETSQGPIVGTGDLIYTMEVVVGELGGTSNIVIAPNHNIGGISPRFTSCKVSSGDNEISIIHSHQNDVCFDKTRLNVEQTLFGESIGFSMRTFRFTSSETATDAQPQKISCSLHLEPSADIEQVQAASCSCFTEEECQAPPSPTVLMLSTTTADNTPMLIGFDGTYNDDLDFEYGAETSVYGGCGAILMDQMMYFGGYFHKNQVSKIEDCKMTRMSDLSFEFVDGSCNTFLEPNPRILLCFDKNDHSRCHTYDGENYDEVPESTHSHRLTLGLGNYKGKPFTTGCVSGSCKVKTEILDMETMTWSAAADYAFAGTYGRIFFYSTAHTSDSVFIIGGKDTIDVVAQFKDDQWIKLPNLNRARSRHNSISIGGRALIVGGASNGSVLMGSTIAITELWDLGDGNSTIIDPSLPDFNYVNGIALFEVDPDFCKK